jgi:tRNA A-37 threonylcarbamoyl transferase component Bud32
MFPNFITRPIKLKKKYIILKMYKNKSLKHFISRHPGKLNIPSIINKVKRMIKTIQLKFPLFRHNDLHTGNIIVDGNKLRLTDFELSRLTGKTPKYMKEYGITSKHNPHYDIHCFLNSLRRVKKYTKVVDKFLPSGYRGKTDKYVRNYRLLF